MGTHDGAVDHRVFIVGVVGKMLENPLPDAGSSPTAEAPMHVLPLTEALRKVTPRNTSPVTVEHGLDEEPVVRCGHANRSRPAWQKVLNPLPLIITHGISAHRS